MKRNVLVSGLAIVALAGCGELQKLDDMRQSTEKVKQTTGEMNNTTSEMNQTTSEMNKTTSEMNQTTAKMAETTTGMDQKMANLQTKATQLNDITNELYDTLRQGNSLQLRRDAYDSILKAPTLYKKISEAGKYFMSYEFQLWNQLGQDSELEKRDILAQQGAMEFFMEIEELAPSDNSVNVTVEPDAKDRTSTANLNASFNAMAATMHKENRKEDRQQIQSTDYKPVSMYSMMEEALLAPRDEAQTGYKREILAHEAKAVQLVKTRYSLFPLIFINAVSGIGTKGLIDKAKMAYFGWDLDLDSLNATQLEYLQTEVLEQAITAKQLLIKLKIKPDMDSTVARLLDKMSINKSGKKPADVIALQNKLIASINELKK